MALSLCSILTGRSRRRLLLSVTAGAIAAFVFFKNAWVSEDAYIVFRSLEQLFAGHGPVWNAHERVQVFTSPLWYCVLALARLVSPNLFLDAIVVSYLLWAATLTVLRTMFDTPSALLWAVLLFCASTGFYDYTSSGLENVLAYFLIALYLKTYLGLHTGGGSGAATLEAQRKSLAQMCTALGLLSVARHDLILLLVPATIATLWERRRLLSTAQWAALGAVSALPLLLYTLSSTIYYGFPFPNTAYAKLNTGISQWLLWEQGTKYLASSIVFDTITLLVIGSAFARTILRGPAHLTYLAVGVALNLAYVWSVGGDFMQGRFLSYSYLVCVVLWISQIEHVPASTWKTAAGTALCGYLVLYPHTPFNSPATHRNQQIHLGIADERGVYFDRLSLINYVNRDTHVSYFPASEEAALGRHLKCSPERVTVDSDLGVLGYHAGLDAIIVDPLALSDPLLARLPVNGRWRIGHFPRTIPDGYVETLRTGTNAIADPRIREFYEHLKILTESTPLFTAARLKTIALFNLGAYDHLIERD